MRNRAIDLLLIPGLLCDERLWVGQAQALSEIASCQTPDLTAYGSIDQMAEGVLSQAPEQFALAGFSMGGCVALEIVARAPQRVRQLALLSTNAAGIMPQVRLHYQESIESLQAGGLAKYLLEAFPRYVAVERMHDSQLWQAFAAMGSDLGAAVAVRQMRALLGYPGFKGDLRAIICPTLLICGEQDERTPIAVHELMATQIPGAELTVIGGAGHFTPLEQPSAVAAALRQGLSRISVAGSPARTRQE
jgi:pimeloyl-ACP methyl ester carboxylesterase